MFIAAVLSHYCSLDAQECPLTVTLLSKHASIFEQVTRQETCISVSAKNGAQYRGQIQSELHLHG